MLSQSVLQSTKLDVVLLIAVLGIKLNAKLVTVILTCKSVALLTVTGVAINKARPLFLKSVSNML